MGYSVGWYSKDDEIKTEFPDINLGLDFNDKIVLNVYDGDWEQKTGFMRDVVGKI